MTISQAILYAMAFYGLVSVLCGIVLYRIELKDHFPHRTWGIRW